MSVRVDIYQSGGIYMSAVDFITTLEDSLSVVPESKREEVTIEVETEEDDGDTIPIIVMYYYREETKEEEKVKAKQRIESLVRSVEDQKKRLLNSVKTLEDLNA